MEKLLTFLPNGAEKFLQLWGKGFKINIKITRERTSKLGDYYKDKYATHHISINHNLPPELFFFVLTHEMAHLITFEKYGRNIAPHGMHWKKVYQSMLIESIDIYNPTLQKIILTYAQNPKAGFLSFTPLVRYFRIETKDNNETFVENIPQNNFFIYRGEIYQQLGKLKKNYLCIQQGSGRKYTFKPLTPVAKIEN